MISLVDEISYVNPPSPPLSQIDDIPPEMFCNGDNKPENCGRNCMCVHKVDIPMNAVVEVVLVDEGEWRECAELLLLSGDLEPANIAVKAYYTEYPEVQSPLVKQIGL